MNNQWFVFPTLVLLMQSLVQAQDTPAPVSTVPADLKPFLEEQMKASSKLFGFDQYAKFSDLQYEAVSWTGKMPGVDYVAKIKATYVATDDLYHTTFDSPKELQDYTEKYGQFSNWVTAFAASSHAKETADYLTQIDPPLSTNDLYGKFRSNGESFSGYVEIPVDHQVDRWILGSVEGYNYHMDIGTNFSSIGLNFDFGLRRMKDLGKDSVILGTPRWDAAVKKMAESSARIDQLKLQFFSKYSAEDQPLLDLMQSLFSGNHAVTVFKKRTTFFGNGPEKTDSAEDGDLLVTAFDAKTGLFKATSHPSTGGELEWRGEIAGGSILLFPEDMQCYYVGEYSSGTLSFKQKGLAPNSSLTITRFEPDFSIRPK